MIKFIHRIIVGQILFLKAAEVLREVLSMMILIESMALWEEHWIVRVLLVDGRSLNYIFYFPVFKAQRWYDDDLSLNLGRK